MLLIDDCDLYLTGKASFPSSPKALSSKSILSLVTVFENTSCLECPFLLQKLKYKEYKCVHKYYRFEAYYMTKIMAMIMMITIRAATIPTAIPAMLPPLD